MVTLKKCRHSDVDVLQVCSNQAGHKFLCSASHRSSTAPVRLHKYKQSGVVLLKTMRFLGSLCACTLCWAPCPVDAMAVTLSLCACHLRMLSSGKDWGYDKDWGWGKDWGYETATLLPWQSKTGKEKSSRKCTLLRNTKSAVHGTRIRLVKLLPISSREYKFKTGKWLLLRKHVHLPSPLSKKEQKSHSAFDANGLATKEKRSLHREKQFSPCSLRPRKSGRMRTVCRLRDQNELLAHAFARRQSQITVRKPECRISCFA